MLTITRAEYEAFNRELMDIDDLTEVEDGYPNRRATRANRVMERARGSGETMMQAMAKAQWYCVSHLMRWRMRQDRQAADNGPYGKVWS